jgi:hypothetical protein
MAVTTFGRAVRYSPRLTLPLKSQPDGLGSSSSIQGTSQRSTI